MTDTRTPTPTRLLLVADGPRGQHARMWIDDVEVTRVAQRLTLDVQAGGVTVAVLSLIPRDGFSIDVQTHLGVALTPAVGYRWIHEPRPDGGWTLRCEAVE